MMNCVLQLSVIVALCFYQHIQQHSVNKTVHNMSSVQVTGAVLADLLFEHSNALADKVPHNILSYIYNYKYIIYIFISDATVLEI